MKELFLSPNDDLQNILNSIAEPTTIYLKSGLYKAKLKVRADDVKIIGEDRETTVISWDDCAKKRHPDGKEYNTFRTYTLCVTGERVTLENLTVENSNAEPERVGQCVALAACGNYFKAANVILKSTQDTLFTAPFPDDLVARYSGLVPEPNSGETYYEGFIPRDELLREGACVQIYENCKIYGNVDFIFGGAEAYFYNCALISLKDARGAGYVAAPCHPLAQERGYAFIDCTFEGGGAEASSVYLARPWRDFGKCDFVNCSLGKHIAPALFDKWNDTYRDRTARLAYFGLSGKVSPVKWGKELSRTEATEIIQQFERRKKSFVAEE